MEQGTPAAQQELVVGYATRAEDHSWAPVVRIAALAAFVYGTVAAVSAAAVLLMQISEEMPFDAQSVEALLDSEYAVMLGGSHPLLDLVIVVAGVAMIAAGWLCWRLRPAGRRLMLGACATMVVLLIAWHGVRSLVDGTWNVMPGELFDALVLLMVVAGLVQSLLVPALLLALMTRPGARHFLGR